MMESNNPQNSAQQGVREGDFDFLGELDEVSIAQIGGRESVKLDSLDLQSLEGNLDEGFSQPSANVQPPLSGVPDDTLINLDNLEEEMDREEPKQKSSNATIYIVAAIIVTVVFALFGVFAYWVLGSSQPAQTGLAQLPANVQSSSQPSQVSDVEIDPAMLGLSQGQAQSEIAGNSQPAGEMLGAQYIGGVVGQPEPSVTSEPSVEISDKDLIVTQGIPQQSTVQDTGAVEDKTSLTDEEHMYDDALSKLSDVNVPEEAIKIDSSVIKRELLNKKVDGIEGNLKSAVAEVGAMKALVSDMKSQIDALSTSISGNEQKQNQLASEIEGLTAAVKESTESQSRAIEELRTAVATAQTTANAAMKEASSKASVVAKASEQARAEVQPSVVQRQEQPVAKQPQPQPQPQPQAVAHSQPVVSNAAQATQQQQVVAANYSMPKPVVRQASTSPKPREVTASVQASDVSGSDLPEHCKGAGAVVSANWRVKGINKFSAYIFRVDDNQGLYVRVGTPVSGFGEVQAFDPSPSNRAVCTTQGLIRR